MAQTTALFPIESGVGPFVSPRGSGLQKEKELRLSSSFLSSELNRDLMGRLRATIRRGLAILGQAMTYLEPSIGTKTRPGSF